MDQHWTVYHRLVSQLHPDDRFQTLRHKRVNGTMFRLSRGDLVNGKTEEQGHGLEPPGCSARIRELAAALHSGDPPFDALPAYFQKQLRPALQTLLEAAAAAGEVRAGVDPDDLSRAVASLSTPAHDGDPAQARRMVALLVDGLRYGATVPGSLEISRAKALAKFPGLNIPSCRKRVKFAE